MLLVEIIGLVEIFPHPFPSNRYGRTPIVVNSQENNYFLNS
jgi:hypothetical protein